MEADIVNGDGSCAGMWGRESDGCSVAGKSSETNLFADGDLGDDEAEAAGATANFWSNQKWFFEGATWDAASVVNYSEWAKQSGESGLAISFDKADGTVSMYQTIDALEAGNYIVTGYVKDTNSKTGTVKLYHGSSETGEEEAAIGANAFNEFTFHFTLSEAQTDYKVGFQITSQSGAWVCIDWKKPGVSENWQRMRD